MHKNQVSILYLCVCIILVFVLIFINTGIDLFDEGYYLLGYDHDQSIFFQYTGFHFIIRTLPYSDHLIMARLYRIALLIFVAFVFAKSLHKNVFNYERFVIVFGYVLLGNFLSYVYCPPSISYNTLSVLFLELIIACYLAFRIKFVIGNSKQMFTVILFGLLLGFIAFNKPTSAIVIVILFAIDQIIYKWRHWNAYIFLLFIVGLSSLITFLALVYASFGQRTFEIAELLTQPGNPFEERHLNPGFMISQLLVNTFIQSKKFLFFTAAYTGFYIVFKKFKKANSWFLLILFSLITLAVFYFYRNIYFGQPGAEYMYAFGLFMIIAWSYEQWESRRNITSTVDYHFVFMLLVLPFAGFWGSDNPPMLGVIHYMVFMLLLLFYINRSFQFQFFQFFPVLISGFVVYSFLWNPFYNPPVFQQNKLIDVRGVKFRVSDYNFNRSVAFDSIKTHINGNLPLIQVNVPNGLLYINYMQNYFTIYGNNLQSTKDYLKLLLLKGVPRKAQVLLYKNKESIDIEEDFQQFQIALIKKHYKFTTIAETDEYHLFELQFEAK